MQALLAQQIYQITVQDCGTNVCARLWDKCVRKIGKCMHVHTWLQVLAQQIYERIVQERRTDMSEQEMRMAAEHEAKAAAHRLDKKHK
jgi:hypothetical protein